MRFSDVAAGAFDQPWQQNQLDARLFAFAQQCHHHPPSHGARSCPPWLIANLFDPSPIPRIASVSAAVCRGAASSSAAHGEGGAFGR